MYNVRLWLLVVWSLEWDYWRDSEQDMPEEITFLWEVSSFGIGSQMFAENKVQYLKGVSKLSSDIREVCMERVCFLLLMTKKEPTKLMDKEDAATVVKQEGTEHLWGGDGSGEIKPYTNISQIAQIWLKLRDQKYRYF